MTRFLLLAATLGLFALCAFRLPAPASESTSVKAESSRIKWLTIQEAYALTQKQPRKFVIDVYTDWCGWCKVMDRETFSKPAIADYVNANYYPVRFNAEQTADVTLGKQTFKYVSGGSRGVQPSEMAHLTALEYSQQQIVSAQAGLPQQVAPSTTVTPVWYLALLIAIVGLVALYTVFQYRNRLTQTALCAVN